MIKSILRSVGILLLVAVTSRMVWEILRPLLPALGILVVLLAIAYVLLAGPRFRD